MGGSVQSLSDASDEAKACLSVRCLNTQRQRLHRLACGWVAVSWISCVSNIMMAHDHESYRECVRSIVDDRRERSSWCGGRAGGCCGRRSLRLDVERCGMRRGRIRRRREYHGSPDASSLIVSGMSDLRCEIMGREMGTVVEEELIESEELGDDVVEPLTMFAQLAFFALDESPERLGRRQRGGWGGVWVKAGAS
jgi:hypothetical protein